MIILKILEIVMAILICCLVIYLVMLWKNEITFKNMIIITDAIALQQYDCLRKGNEDFVQFTSMKSYDEALYNLFDWGYKNILPPEDFEKIKPFLFKKGKANG